MSSIVILAASFIAALIGIIRNNRAKPGEKSIFGLNFLGAVLLGLSIAGATATLVQEIWSWRTKAEIEAENERTKAENERITNTMNDAAQDLRRLIPTLKDPDVKRAVTRAGSLLGSMEFPRGKHASIPPWVPIFPGIRPEDVQGRKDQNGWSGSYTFKPEMTQFFEWYRDRLRETGFTITTYDVIRYSSVLGGRLVARDRDGHHRITLIQNVLDVKVLWEERDK